MFKLILQKTPYKRKVEYVDGASALTSQPHHVDFLCTKQTVRFQGNEWALGLTDP